MCLAGTEVSLWDCGARFFNGSGRLRGYTCEMVTGILNSALAGAERKAEPVATVPPSLADVYEDEFKYVHRCLRGFGVPTSALDDALQDVFVVVQQKLSSFDGKNRLRTWLYAIALRVARRYCEQAAKAASRHVEESAVPLKSPSANAAEQQRQQQQLELAHQALQTLPFEKREVFVLHQIEQLSAPEIAELANIPVNTVYSRLRAAKFEFRTAVSRIQGQTRPKSQQPQGIRRPS